MILRFALFKETSDMELCGEELNKSTVSPILIFSKSMITKI